MKYYIIAANRSMRRTVRHLLASNDIKATESRILHGWRFDFAVEPELAESLDGFYDGIEVVPSVEPPKAKRLQTLFKIDLLGNHRLITIEKDITGLFAGKFVSRIDGIDHYAATSLKAVVADMDDTIRVFGWK